MATSISLKNIPDDFYARLRAAAGAHRRSMNSEAIICLETVLVPTKVSPAEPLARARELRAALGSARFDAHRLIHRTGND